MPIVDYKKFIEKYGLGQKSEEIKESDLLPFKELLPKEIYELLDSEGISSFMDGFLWTLNPSEHTDWLNNWLKFETRCIPFARTALGDVFFIKDNKVTFLHSSDGLIEYVTKRINWFFDRFLTDEVYVEKYFNKLIFNEIAKEKQTLNHYQCFGFDQLLSNDGEKKESNLKKYELKKYLSLLSENRKDVEFVKV